MRRSWRRFWRRKQKLFIGLSFLSLLNLTFPQHVQAATLGERMQSAAVSVKQPAEVLGARQAAVFPKAERVKPKRTLRVVATAYSSSYAETDADPFTTASGAKVRDGVIAANGFPFGTRIRIPNVYGEKVFIVLDRMSSRYGRNRIDIWMTSRAAAIQWGVQSIKIEVL